MSEDMERGASAGVLMPSTAGPHFETPIALDRDQFMRRLIASLGHLNEGILGSDVAGAYIMNVGLSMGAAIEAEYKRFWGIERPFTLDEYAHVIVDLKQKIHGNFSLVSKDPAKVVVRTTSCPFEDFVRQSPSLCFMTSSVFGGIAARNFGYAKVVLHKRIALGDPGCYVTIHLQPTPEAEHSIGKEYYPEIERSSPDISEQLRLMDNVRRLRQQLGEVSSRWEEIVRGAAEAIAVMDRDGRIVYANAHWRELLGIEGAELVGGHDAQLFEALVHPGDMTRARDIISGSLVDGRAIGVPLRLQHRDGTWRDTLLSVGPVRDEHGQVLGTMSIIRDVTEEREAQRLKNEFLATASHELRTPATTIRALAGMLRRQLQQGQKPIDPQQFVTRLETIERETDRLTQLSTRLVDVVRLQQGRLMLRCERHDMNELVARSVERAGALPDDGRRHTFVVRAAPHPLPVNVESPRIEQLLDNLLSNAVKFSPDGGEIVVAVEGDEQWVYVRVTDQGIGIPAADLPRLFQPFYRGSNVSAEHFTGLGLGLYLSRATAEVHGGKLTVSSTEGQGSTFALALPLAPAPEASAGDN